MDFVNCFNTVPSLCPEVFVILIPLVVVVPHLKEQHSSAGNKDRKVWIMVVMFVPSLLFYYCPADNYHFVFFFNYIVFILQSNIGCNKNVIVIISSPIIFIENIIMDSIHT